jgi:ferredoxin-NADP reductase
MISTRIRDSPYKQRLSSLEEGVKVKVRGPEGKFVLHEDYSKPAVFLSGGIGVTPFRSMIKYATDKQLPIKIIMFDSNRNEQNILYKNEFYEWVNTNKNLKIVFAITEEDGKKQSSTSSSWTREKGRIDKEAPSANNRLPTPRVTGNIFNQSSSTKSCFKSVWMRLPLP